MHNKLTHHQTAEESLRSHAMPGNGENVQRTVSPLSGIGGCTIEMQAIPTKSDGGRTVRRTFPEEPSCRVATPRNDEKRSVVSHFPVTDNRQPTTDNRFSEETKEDFHRRFSEGGRRLRQRRLMMLKITGTFIVQVISGGKRMLDLAAACVLLLVFSPLLAAAFFLGGRKLRRTPRTGRWCEIFDEFSFVVPEGALGRLIERLRLHSLPVLFNILRGDMSFVGPRPVSPGTLSPLERAARKRYNVRPGLICLWWVRRRAHIAFDSEVESDSEYVDAQTFWGDLGIALRAVPAVLYGEDTSTTAELVSILGIGINNLTMNEAQETILNRLSAEGSSHVCFVNADCANIACRDADYLAILNRAELTLADGIGMKLAGKLLGRKINQNVNGTDLFPRLCAGLSGTVHSLFLLGAKPGVAEAVHDWIARVYPEVKVSGCHHGYFSPTEESGVIRQIRDSGAALLLVAFGAPKQDKWIDLHLPETGAKVAIGVGGLFDFYSGNISRAPQWMREMGLEWLYRFFQEPGRMWRRYFLGNAIFLYRVFKEKML